MIFAFCLYKYFPYGGLQRDFLRIAQAMQARGHRVRVYCHTWQGDVPPEFEIVNVPVKGYTSQAKNRFFSRFMQQDLAQRPVDCVVGFNKMPGLDVYYAADSCYAAKPLHKRSKLYTLMPRYRHFKRYEEAIFACGSNTQILLLSPTQKTEFRNSYATELARLHLLPASIDESRRAPSNAEQVRTAFRQEFAIADDDFLLLQIGSGFITKGVDRSLQALAALPKELLVRTHLHVVGQDKAKKFEQLAVELGVADRVTFFDGRDDVPCFLQGADLLIHPARAEAAGMILVEAVVAGLPVLTTAVCGYAFHVEQANAGATLTAPFDQNALNKALVKMIVSPDRAQWRENGLRYAEQESLYSQTKVVADFLEDQLTRGST